MKSVLSTFQVDAHEFTTGTRDTTEFLVSSLLPDDKADEDTPLQANIRERASLVAPEPVDWNPISPGDVQYYIDTVKRRKAPGPISCWFVYGVPQDWCLPSTMEEGSSGDSAQEP